MAPYSKVSIVKPKGWTLEFSQIYTRDTSNPSGSWRDNLELPKFKRKGTFASHCDNYESAHEIELRHHYNGGGQTAFGGARDWPYVSVGIAFNCGEEQLASQFATEVGDFINQWLESQKR